MDSLNGVVRIDVADAPSYWDIKSKIRRIRRPKIRFPKIRQKYDSQNSAKIRK